MPIYRITDPTSGKTLKLTGDSPPTEAELNEIFSGIGAGRETTAKPESFLGKLSKSFEPGLGGVPKFVPRIAGRALNLPSQIMGGALKAGRETLTGQYQPPKIGPEFRVGKGTTSIGKLLHPALVGAVRGVTQKQSVLEELPKTVGVEPSSIPGLAIGLAGEVATPDIADVLKFGDIASKLLQKSGGAMKETGEKLVLRALRPSPSQLTNFSKKTGENLVDFMTRNKITKNFIEEAGSKLDELQNLFDEIAIKSGKKVDTNVLKKAFDNQIEEYSQSIAPALKTKAEDIKQVFDNLINKFGADGVDVGELTKERKTFDALLKEGQFSLPPEAANYYRTVRDILQESIRKATEDLKIGGKGLRELGQEIHKFIEFEKIAKRQSGLGKGTSLVGLADLLAGIGGASYGRTPEERVKNALAMIFGRKILSSPTIVGQISKVTQKTGKGISDSQAIKRLLEFVLRGVKEGVIKIPQ